MAVTLTLTGIVDTQQADAADVTVPFLEVEACLNGGTAITPAISGGTINNATVGATTQASGRFSSLDVVLAGGRGILRLDHNGSAGLAGTIRFLVAGSEESSLRYNSSTRDITIIDALAAGVDRFILNVGNGNVDIKGYAIVRGSALEIDGVLDHDGSTVGLYATTPVVQYSTTGTVTGFTAGSGTAVKDDSTFTGNTGSTAYTVGDIVRALKLIGLVAA